MATFGGFGGGGFGSQNNNNNQQPSSGFGGFGANNNTTSGFGAANNSGFGATNNNTTGGGLFGGGTSGGFGSSGGFGATQNNNAFGAKPAFGSSATSTGGGLFGAANTTGTTGFGGFGANTGTASTGFGQTNTNTGGGLFGANKTTGFGANSTTTSNPFGTAATNTGFGGATTTNAFGAPAATALGGNRECPGTANVPFQAFVEKEPNSNTNQQNSFQSICFQQPYINFSPEELRLADYTQGRRYGNNNNQGGAFGTNTNFGSFGANNQTATTGFGATNTGAGTNLFGSGGGFGATSQPQTTGFGTTATTGMFGAAKPAATGSLFGAQPQQSTGLFGQNNNTSGGFGTSTATGGFGAQNNNTSGGLFGNNNAAKPATTFSFGNNNATATSSAAPFGAAAAPTTGFGSGSLFGNNNQQQNTTNPFGTASQPQQQSTPAFGGFGNTAQQPATGGGLFGNTQQKPATTGLFGSTAQQPAATGTGLFGSTNTQPATNTGGLFGNNSGGGLFGQQKPAATTGTGLFGNAQSTQNNSSGGGLFGGGGFGTSQTQQQPQQTTGGLFGGLNNNNQAKPSLFSQPQQSGTSLFGNSGTQQSGLFGSTNNNQTQQQAQPTTSLFGGGSSIMNGSQQNNQQQVFTASLNDPGSYGHGSLFGSLGPSTQNSNPGPLAIPISSTKPKRSTPLPIYKLNSVSRYNTPSKRGYGLSYSNYGSPSSSTASTPNLNGSLLGNSLGRGLSKSISASSLRRSFNSEDSVLAPGALSASPSARHYGSTGGMKKLVINRTLRSDLFSPPSQQAQQNPPLVLQPTSANGNSMTGSINSMKKTVSFDSGSLGGANGGSSPLRQMQSNAEPTSEQMGLIRPTLNGSTPEMTQVKGNELAIVQEEPTSSTSDPKTTGIGYTTPGPDKEPGDYWMKPSKEEIEGMSQKERSQVKGFTVGRQNVGFIVFDGTEERQYVDLTTVNLDRIFDETVNLKARCATVYGTNLPGLSKPPVGKGLNVPSTITLFHAWPRKGNGKVSESALQKHIQKLKEIEGTTLVSYSNDTGVWVFTVPHYTTYELDYDDEDSGEEDAVDFGQSTLSAPPDSPTPNSRSRPSARHDQSYASSSEDYQVESGPEDTFDFRKKKLPGAFDEGELYDDEDMEDHSPEQGQQSFLDERSVGLHSENDVEEPMDEDDAFEESESVGIVDQEMAGSYPEAGNTAEHFDDSQHDDEDMVWTNPTGGIMRARERARKIAGTPSKTRFAPDNDWANTLRNTVSPKKQDRALLKSLIDIHGNESRLEPDRPQQRNRIVSDGHGFATSIDLMKSLYGETRSPGKKAKIPAQSKGFKWPYSKRPKTVNDEEMSEDERAFHDSWKPSWGPDGTLVYAVGSNAKSFGRSSRRAREQNGLLAFQQGVIVSESRDVHFAKFSNEDSAHALKKHIALTDIIIDSKGTPYATLRDDYSMLDFFDDRNSKQPDVAHEKLVWELASILFDEIIIPEELDEVPKIEARLRKDKLSEFWANIVDPASSQQVAITRVEEEKAIACLAGHRVADACAHLLKGKNFHLATLVAMIGGKERMRKELREQLNHWQKQNTLSEFSQPIRAIYEMLAGNVCIVNGSKGGPLEDRIESFVMSTRFGLDWRQAFGLRLWYGILAGDPIQSAVEQFEHDLHHDLEGSRPHAWYVEQRIPPLWDDPELDIREDLLWGLLKLYSSTEADLEAIIRPENSRLSPVDMRLTWQLGRALTSIGDVYFQGDDVPNRIDHATISFAAQLTGEGSWLEAVFVLLHLRYDRERAKAIQDHLAQHGGLIGAEDSHSFTTLTEAYKIPTRWVWEAKALFMRSVKNDPKAEVDCLLKAGSYEEAHRTFSTDVAPKTIIERDHATLRTLLDGFRGKEKAVADWTLGGEIYEDFLTLLESDKRLQTVDYPVLGRLLAALPAAVEESRHPGFMEVVAIETISAFVAKAVVEMGKKGDKGDLPKILRLPLTEDKYLQHTVDLSLGYYRDVMGGK